MSMDPTQSANVAQALLGLREPKETVQKKAKLNVSLQKKALQPLIVDLPVEQRQVVFKMALQTAGNVVDSVWKCALEAGNITDENNIPQVVVNQLCAIQSFYCLVVAELGKACRIVNTDTNELQMKMIEVIVEEIKRLGSPKTAVELLRLLSVQVDQALVAAGIAALTGSLTLSLTKNFQMLRRCVKKNPQSGKFEIVAPKHRVQTVQSPMVVPTPLKHNFLAASKEPSSMNTFRMEATVC